MTLVQWSDPPDTWAIADDDVHVWRVSLDVAPSVTVGFADTLTDAERARARRFRHDADARRFIVTRGVLRAILASYVGVIASRLVFRAGSYGKPQLAALASQGAREVDIRFNVSHSGELALLAVARGREVGIDIERIDARIDTEALARRFFSEAEQACLSAVEETSRAPAVYRAWTSKEAYLKLRGVGMSVPLDSFDVSLRPGEPAALLGSRETNTAVSRSMLMDLPTGAAYAANLAIDGTPAAVHLWQWRETSA